MTAPVRAADAGALAQLAVLVADDNPAVALRRACRIGAGLLRASGGVSVSLSHGGDAVTFAASNDLVLGLDESQYANSGPCVQALTSDERVESADLRLERRWADWTPSAVEAGVTTMLCVPLPRRAPFPAAVNVYGQTDDFLLDPVVMALADVLAAHIGVLLVNVILLEANAAVVSQMKDAMASRSGIEQAKGVLMGALAVDAETAFAYLVRLSQSRHVKLRDVADATLAQAVSGKFRAP